MLDVPVLDLRAVIQQPEAIPQELAVSHNGLTAHHQLHYDPRLWTLVTTVIGHPTVARSRSHFFLSLVRCIYYFSLSHPILCIHSNILSITVKSEKDY
jgi:hypothetical protein